MQNEIFFLFSFKPAITVVVRQAHNLSFMKKIFALLAATVVIASASFAQTGKMKSDTTHHKTMHKTTTHKMTKKPMKKDSTK